jgi:hypothetical protein
MSARDPRADETYNTCVLRSDTPLGTSGGQKPMKVLIADIFPEAGRAAVARAGVEVVYDPELNDTALTAAVRSTAADILVVRSTKVPLGPQGRPLEQGGIQ